ncbi:uncharacterized protein LOC110007529 [Amborella trichopoda]|uniref:uncharacterized protein LOC110007529 n=1 Tax=Amborella trichopoda TaxID=13333 RepID=UPI0009C14099|nr:uncharacterized protein LOC110007529 [Amborella trichopoda]|eukprot:XP_020524637.1 uncharacterized protein LOC110007529 [Amborella trichopoda]
MKDCPVIKLENRLKTLGRVFVLTKQEAKASTTVFQATLFVCGREARILIDAGSSHSFVAPHFAYQMNIEPSLLEYTLVVGTPVGDSMETDMVYKQCEAFLEGCVLLIDLILLDIQDFNVILSMDWLSTHPVTVVYYNKTVTFKRPNQPKLHFVGIKDALAPHFISTLRTYRHLAKGGVKYLAYVVENRDVLAKLEEILVVREFPRTFTKELLSLPPVREIEFEMDVLPSTAPISKAPYWMAPAELKVLKEKL